MLRTKDLGERRVPWEWRVSLGEVTMLQAKVFFRMVKVEKMLEWTIGLLSFEA